MLLSTAQKVRLWFMLAAIIIGFIGLIVGSAQNGEQLGGMATMSMSTWNDMQGAITFGLLSLGALAVLGPITLWRFLHPRVAASTGRHGGSYAPEPVFPAAPQYQQPLPATYPPHAYTPRQWPQDPPGPHNQ